ncbi:MAG: ABC transporter ATP-binding protein [Spirochaetota bacterium]
MNGSVTQHCNPLLKDLILKIEELKVFYHTDEGTVKAVDGINLDLASGERLGLVGESGCGKSTVAMAIMGLIKPPGRIEGGKIIHGEVDLTELSEWEMRMYRLNRISLIPQGAMNSLNPVSRVKDQIIDGIKAHSQDLSEKEMSSRVYELLESVGLKRDVARMYPHELSGGMKQRVCVAIAISLHPQVIIADEPTSALDVVVQREVMETIGRLQQELNVSIILLGHDMGLMAQFVDRLAVMYAGKLAEIGSVKDLFARPLHPYTQLLIASLPTLGKRGVFKGIPGLTPSLVNVPPGCLFHPRCPSVMDICSREVPTLKEIDGRQVACHLYNSEVLI